MDLKYGKLLLLVGLETDGENLAVERVPVQRADGPRRLLVVSHVHEREAPILLGLGVFYHFDGVDGAVRAEQLPQRELVGVVSYIVHVHRGARRFSGRGHR